MEQAFCPGGLVIGRLRGTLVATREGYLVLDVNGVGYEVAVTPRTVGELPSVGEEVVLHTHLHLREDGMALYGFTTESERQLPDADHGLRGGTQDGADSPRLEHGR